MTRKRKIQAIILAGGFGTRLHPLTDNKPKPLVTILDKTVLETVLDRVKKTVCENITVSAHFKPDMIEKFCREYDKCIEVKRELAPLGTAGGVKFSSRDGFDAYLVVSGDGFFDFDLDALIDEHFKRGADVTVCTCRNEDPTRYGCVVAENGRITSFCEKPSWKNVKSSVVNTGMYVLSRYALDRIPSNTVYDFSKDLFPKLMKEGRLLSSVTLDGSWCDIGSLDEYYLCNLREAQKHFDIGKSIEELRSEGVQASGKIYVSKDAHIGKNVSIKDSVICSGCIIGDGCDISESVIGKGCSIGEGSSISGGICGEYSSFGENCMVNRGTVIGNGCRLADSCMIKKNTRIKSGESVYSEGRYGMDFSREKNIFKDDGVCIFEKDEGYSALVLFAKSQSLAFSKNGKTRVRIALGYSREAEGFKNAFMTGFAMTDSVVYDCGKCTKNILRHTEKQLGCDAGVFLYADRERAAAYISVCGFAADDEAERKIIKTFCDTAGEETQNLRISDRFEKVKIPAESLYKTNLCRFSRMLLKDKTPGDVQVCFSLSELAENGDAQVLRDVLKELGCKVSDVTKKGCICVGCDENGLTLRQDGVTFDRYHLCAAVLKNAWVFGDISVNLGANAPEVLKRMAADVCDTENGVRILDDDCALITAVTCAVSLRGEGLMKLMSELPRFEIFNDEYLADVNRAEGMERLSKMYADTKDDSYDGIHFSLAEGSVTVVPGRAKGFKIMAEAVSMEAAKELAVKVGKAIKS